MIFTTDSFETSCWLKGERNGEPWQVFEPSGSALKMIRQLKSKTRKEGTFHTEVFCEHYSSSSNSSCSSLYSSTSFTKTESHVSEISYTAQAMFPEFFAQRSVTEGPFSSESASEALSCVTSSMRPCKKRKGYREIDDEIKIWFIREYGLDNALR